MTSFAPLLQPADDEFYSSTVMERLTRQGGHDEYQCDAREARLARGFEMDDRWFGLGDRCRYHAK